jgi:hypothetical protein
MLPRLLLTALTALALLVGAAPADAAPRRLPVVDMSAVVLAAQVEGFRGNQPGLGDDASTILVQRALAARGFPVVVDGHYGRATTAAYAKFQRSLGYRSINANGIPGPASLAVLAQNRFALVNIIQVGSRRDVYGVKRVNTRTRMMLAAADAAVPWSIVVSQGSYCRLEGRCAGASGGTHDGGGALDIRVSGLTSTQRWRTVRALRAVGFAAWLRSPGQCGGCWPYHIHAIAIGDTDLWQGNGRYTNRDQVADYYVGRNGLGGHARDNTPLKYRVPFTTYERAVSSVG